LEGQCAGSALLFVLLLDFCFPVDWELRRRNGCGQPMSTMMISYRRLGGLALCLSNQRRSPLNCGPSQVIEWCGERNTMLPDHAVLLQSLCWFRLEV
jgi:hypothetical protein